MSALPTINDPLDDPGPWCDAGDGEAIPGRCPPAPLRPEEEARLRAAYAQREPYWDHEWRAVGLLSSLDAARRQLDALRRQVDAMRHPLAPIPFDSPAGQEIAAAWRAAIGTVCPLCHETRQERRLGADRVIACGCPAHADDPPEVP